MWHVWSFSTTGIDVHSMHVSILEYLYDQLNHSYIIRSNSEYMTLLQVPNLFIYLFLFSSAFIFSFYDNDNGFIMYSWPYDSQLTFFHLT